MPKDAPLVAATEHRALFSQVVDAKHMKAVFQKHLPDLARGNVRVTRCKTKPVKSRRILKKGQMGVVYAVTIESDGGRSWEHTLLGTAPVDPDFIGTRLQEQCQKAAGHPLVEPFKKLAAYLPEVQMGIQVFPVDPCLPAMVEMTRGGCGPIVAPFLPACHGGSSIRDVVSEVKHYKPASRSVLRLTVHFNPTDDGPSKQVVYAKIFSDDRGAENYERMRQLWEVSSKSSCLRTPQPYGYDPQRRMLLMSELRGEEDLTNWIDCLEDGCRLPRGVDLCRLERCMEIVTQALAELHGSGLQISEQRTFQSELADRRKDLQWLGSSQPELVGEVQRVLSRLEALAPDDEVLVPSHGGFRHKQMLGDENSLTIFDWDGLTMAPPALDAAYFICRLRQAPIEKPGSAREMEYLAEIFRREFRKREPLVSAEQLALYEAQTLVQKSLRSFRRPSSPQAMTREVRNLLAAAEQVLDKTH